MVWIAPEEAVSSVNIVLFEDDVGSAVNPPDTGNRDDAQLEHYGQSQDRIVMDVVEMRVEFVSRTSGTTTHSDNTYGANSRGKLGLWKYDIPNYSGSSTWALWCEHWTNGNFKNDGAEYLHVYDPEEWEPGTYRNGHPLATGTLLKSEMYAHLKNRSELPDSALPAVNNKENWRILQEKKGWEKVDGTKTKEWIDWADDGVYVSSGMRSFFDPEYNHLYICDMPGLHSASDSSGSDDGTLEKIMKYRDKVQFRFAGKWHDVCDFPPDELRKWEMHRCKLKKVDDAWTIEDKADGNDYEY